MQSATHDLRSWHRRAPPYLRSTKTGAAITPSYRDMILQRRRLQTRPRLRAVVPAAGLGTRPRPLTAELPKALLPVLGRPLIAWTLERLAGAGVEAIAINLHHRGE